MWHSKTSPCKKDPLTPHFYIVNMGGSRGGIGGPVPLLIFQNMGFCNGNLLPHPWSEGGPLLRKFSRSGHGKAGVYGVMQYFLIFALKYRSWVRVRTTSLIHNFPSENYHFYSREILQYITQAYLRNGDHTWHLLTANSIWQFLLKYQGAHAVKLYCFSFLGIDHWYFRKDLQMLLTVIKGEIKSATPCTRSHIATSMKKKNSFPKMKKLTTKLIMLLPLINNITIAPEQAECCKYRLFNMKHNNQRYIHQYFITSKIYFVNEL